MPERHVNAVGRRFDTVLIVGFVLAFLAGPVIILANVRSSNEHFAHERAMEISMQLTALRRYYADNVLARLDEAGVDVVVSDRYADTPGAIPLDITFAMDAAASFEAIHELVEDGHADDGEGVSSSMDMTASPAGGDHEGHSATGDDDRSSGSGRVLGGEKRSSLTVEIVSDHPFSLREDVVMNAFEEEALAAFRADPSLAVFQTTRHPLFGAPVHQHATPMVMEPACVACHNGHPDATKTDWRVGDVRGIQVVEVVGYSALSGDATPWLVPYVVLVMLFSFGSITVFRRSNRRLALANVELEAARKVEAESAARLAVQAEQLQDQVGRLELLGAVAESASFGVTIADARVEGFPIVYANAAFYEMLGLGEAEVMGQTCRVLRGAITDPKLFDEMRSKVSSGIRHTVEIPDKRANGEPFWNRMTMFPVGGRPDDPTYYVSFQMDVTKEREAEADRARMLAEIQEAQKFESLGVLVAGVAHEINTPLGVAMTAVSHIDRTQGELEDLLRQVADSEIHVDLRAVLDEQAEAFKLVQSNLRRSAELVTGFKEVAADRSDDDMRTVDLASYVGSVATTLSPLLKRSGCTLSLDVSPGIDVRIPTGSFGQILTNLVVNATVHAFEGVTGPRIDVVAREVGDEIVLAVRDNGVGIGPDLMSKLFTPFFSTKRGVGGTGLGLYIARRIATTTLGGDLTVANRPEGGAEFTLRFTRIAEERP
jgi:PAS domain S-box-containing protein